MDYKEEYNKALERAKKGLPIDEVFPELKESEDEKIRNEIISCIKSHVLPGGLLIRGGEFYREDAISYLEKPKEQNLIPKFKVGDRIYDKRDSYNRNVIREVGKDYYINAFAQKMDMAYTDANFEFLEHLDNETPASKLTEWSEEDEKIYQSIMDDTVQENQLNDKQTNWLNDIKYRYFPQPKQKWSEEGKKKISELKTFIAQCNGFNKENRKKAFDMIDALRPQPHWKPSEEQMEILQYVCEESSHPNQDVIPTLQSLYNDLKKL